MWDSRLWDESMFGGPYERASDLRVLEQDPLGTHGALWFISKCVRVSLVFHQPGHYSVSAVWCQAFRDATIQL